MNLARDILHAEKGLVEGMRSCLSGSYIGSTLVLAYVLMDVLAWLSLPEGRDEVSRKAFIAWVEKYVMPSASLECTADDLYAARCGILHTLTPDSEMARQGKAVRIAYSWGVKKPYPRQKLESYGICWIMLHVDALCAATVCGAEKFWKDIEADPKRLALVNRRADKLLKDDPWLPAGLP